MFQVENNTVWKKFKLHGRVYEKEIGELKLIQVKTGYAICEFKGIRLSIDSENLTDLMMFGTFVKGVYDKEVIIIKGNSEVNLIAIPTESETFSIISERKSETIKLSTGNKYLIEGKEALYLGFFYLDTMRYDKKYSTVDLFNLYRPRHIFLINGEISEYFNRKDFFLEELLDVGQLEENIEEFMIVKYLAKLKNFFRRGESCFPHFCLKAEEGFSQMYGSDFFINLNEMSEDELNNDEILRYIMKVIKLEENL